MSLLDFAYISERLRNAFGEKVYRIEEEPTPTQVEPQFHYLDDDFQVAKGMTKAFNQICSEEGVQCTVTMDSRDFRQLYLFKNVGDKLVKIMYNDQEWFLEPNESTEVKVSSYLGLERPYVIALNSGT
jgi:hypothetical protein